MHLLELAGEDDRLAVREAATVAAEVSPLAAGLATARGAGSVERLALTHRVSRLVGVADGTPADAERLLAAAASPGDGAGEGSGTVAVRARDVRSTTGVDTQRVERRLGDALVERGHQVDLDDPDHELRALFARPDAWSDPGADLDRGDDGDAAGVEGVEPVTAGPTPETDRETVCALAWLDREVPREFAPQPTDRPFFQPGSMAPALARALSNLAGAAPGRRLVDPMCGTGGLLVEAGLVGASVVGVDARERMARGAARNLREYVGGGATVVGDAARLPLADDSADGVLFDAPYGRQSAIRADDLRALVDEALREACRLAPRAVVVGDRAWRDAARGAGWHVDTHLRRRVHRSLVRHVLVLVDPSNGGPDDAGAGPSAGERRR